MHEPHRTQAATNRMLAAGSQLLRQSHLNLVHYSGVTADHVICVLTGFCMKTKTDRGDKVFINICWSDQASHEPAGS